MFNDYTFNKTVQFYRTKINKWFSNGWNIASIPFVVIIFGIFFFAQRQNLKKFKSNSENFLQVVKDYKRDKSNLPVLKYEYHKNQEVVFALLKQKLNKEPIDLEKLNPLINKQREDFLFDTAVYYSMVDDILKSDIDAMIEKQAYYNMESSSLAFQTQLLISLAYQFQNKNLEQGKLHMQKTNKFSGKKSYAPLLYVYAPLFWNIISNPEFNIIFPKNENSKN